MWLVGYISYFCRPKQIYIMTFDEIMSGRKSIRKFDPEKTVSEDVVGRILSAVTYAPTWKNSQTCRYHVVLSDGARKALRECLSPKNAENAENAQVLAVTTYVRHISGFEKDGTPTNELADGWGIYDAGIATSYMLLKASELGVDSLVMGIRDAEAIRTLLDIPEDEAVLSVIAFGYRAVEPQRPPRKTLEEIVRYY